ncbi:Uncharacterised protein [Mycobacteroides abscessus subsp. massiliense]|nr:Uncharacterised protein [Mycobacteroides abscessus subsp. massiliense]
MSHGGAGEHSGLRGEALRVKGRHLAASRSVQGDQAAHADGRQTGLKG